MGVKLFPHTPTLLLKIHLPLAPSLSHGGERESKEMDYLDGERENVVKYDYNSLRLIWESRPWRDRLVKRLKEAFCEVFNTKSAPVASLRGRLKSSGYLRSAQLRMYLLGLTATPLTATS